jgi:hypothetical protein
MKIVTWNCNLNLERKFDLLQSLTPDITIIQECEKLEENHFSSCKYFWCGENEKKGRGSFVFFEFCSKCNLYAKSRAFLYLILFIKPIFFSLVKFKHIIVH